MKEAKNWCSHLRSPVLAPGASVRAVQVQRAWRFRFRQNKSPFAGALGDWFPLRTYFSTSKASPNDPGIVIVVIIVVTGKAGLILHGDGIIAQTY